MTDGTNAIQHQEQPINPDDRQPPAEGQQPPPPAVSDDPDEQAVRDAVAAVEAEENAARAGTEGEPGQPKEQAQGQQQQEQPVETPMIPKPRFDEVAERARQAEQHAAYWRGVAEARQQPGQPGQPAQQQQPQATPEQRIAEFDKQIDALSTKFDNGEITMAELRRQERELQRQQEAVRTASQQAPQQSQPRQANDDLFLESKTAQLEQAHPWIKVFEAVGTDAHWGLLKAEAIDNLTKQGIDPRQGNWGRLQLRTEIARLADEYGPSLVAERAKAQGIALPGQSQEQPAQNQQRQPSPAAAARQTKLQMQEQSPPDLTAMRGGGGDPNIVTETQVTTMSEDELDALPIATRQKFLGISA